jgi:hypothetical protein
MLVPSRVAVLLVECHHIQIRTFRLYKPTPQAHQSVIDLPFSECPCSVVLWGRAMVSVFTSIHGLLTHLRVASLRTSICYFSAYTRPALLKKHLFAAFLPAGTGLQFLRACCVLLLGLLLRGPGGPLVACSAWLLPSVRVA